jgi:hypothetical protein
MKKILFSVGFALIFSYGYSQNFHAGIVAGLNGSQVDGDTQAGFDKVGAIFGLFVDYPISEKISVGSEVYYIGKGALKTDKLADGTSVQEFKTVLNYIEIPFLFRYQVLKKISLAVGIAPAYLFSDKLYNQGLLISANEYNIRNYDISPILEADFQFFKKLGITLRYSLSIITIRTDDNHFWYNRDLSVGLRYKIK